jgi:hypothetical protein
MTHQSPEAAHRPPLAVLSPTETLLLEVISNLEIELAEARLSLPKKPPPGWQRVGTVADRLALRNFTIYRM